MVAAAVMALVSSMVGLETVVVMALGVRVAVGAVVKVLERVAGVTRLGVKAPD
jgi:hypothetical protein